jgi:hypothetical protein
MGWAKPAGFYSDAVVWVRFGSEPLTSSTADEKKGCPIRVYRKRSSDKARSAATFLKSGIVLTIHFHLGKDATPSD